MILNPYSGQPFPQRLGSTITSDGSLDVFREALRLTSDDRLYTRDELVEIAIHLGYGKAETLTRLHRQWCELRVLWRPDRKESRRGGAGLWNQDQAWLWLECLRRRRDFGIQGLPRNLAVLPIGLWLWGRPGIPLDHARQAFRLRWTAYLSRPMATGEDARKSRKRKEIAREARRLLGRNPGYRLLEELRNVEPMGDRRVEFPLHSIFISQLIEGSGRPRWEAEQIAHGLFYQIATAAMALDNLWNLCNRSDGDWPALWEWARESLWRTWQKCYLEVSQGKVRLPHDLYDSSAKSFLENADRNLLMVLGVGLYPPLESWPADEPLPPAALPGLRTPRSW